MSASDQNLYNQLISNTQKAAERHDNSRHIDSVEDD